MRCLLPIAALLPTMAMAEAPRVVTDIAPVHSLVAQVMGELGTPENLIDPTLSPHDFNLKPSQARALQEAGLLIMIGHELTPWLADRADELMAQGTVLTLLDASPSQIEPGGDHGDHDDHHDEHDHEKHDHDEHQGEHEEDAAKEDDHDGHNHAIDPHVWLNPENAAAWLGVIAKALTELDPDNAKQYQINANQALIGLQGLDESVNRIIEPVRSGQYMVYHDAYAYFAVHYGLLPQGALTSNEGAPPSAADVQDARDLIASGDVTCFFTEAQYSASVVKTVTEGLEVKTQSLDPLGVKLEPGPGLYGDLLTGMATAFRECLS